jgi:hypothetical protein
VDIPAASTPIVCDMTTAPDTTQQRLEEYRHLFGRHLIDRDKTGQGIRFRLRAEPGVAAWVRDLAAREKACCAFFAFDITVDGEQVIWDCAVSDNDTARALLEEYYQLPETAAHIRSADELDKHLTGKGLHFVADPADPLRYTVA